VIDAFNKLVAPLKNRIMLMISRGVLESSDDSTGVQTIQASLLKGEVNENIARMQNYGFTSRPISGAEALVLFPSGNREHGIAVVVDDRTYRLKGLAEGEVALYDDQGQIVHIKRDRILIQTSKKIVLDGPNIELGSTALEKVLKGETFQSFFNSHTHTGNLGAPTGPPNSPSVPAHLSTVVKAG
jgi:phage baseplate assembly protein V